MKKIIIFLANKFYPELAASKSDLLQMNKSLGNKLKEAKEEAAKYRKRAFQAEDLIQNLGYTLKNQCTEYSRYWGRYFRWY